jgi:hypothetical protein
VNFFKFSPLIILIFLSAAYALSGAPYLSGTFLSLKEAKSKWGSLEFKASDFIKSNERQKGSMAVSLLEKKIYINEPMSVVRADIGAPDSYFFSDTIYAYEITPPKENKEQWQLIFVPDDKLEKVTEMKIHKKCCYKSAF